MHLVAIVTCMYTQMGYGSHALDLLGKYYEGRVASLSEGHQHVDPVTCIDPDQVCGSLFSAHYILLLSLFYCKASVSILTKQGEILALSCKATYQFIKILN